MMSAIYLKASALLNYRGIVISLSISVMVLLRALLCISWISLPFSSMVIA
jgi:hypothetical protein